MRRQWRPGPPILPAHWQGNASLSSWFDLLWVDTKFHRTFHPALPTPAAGMAPAPSSAMADIMRHASGTSRHMPRPLQPCTYCAATRSRTLPSRSSKPAGICGNHLMLAIACGEQMRCRRWRSFSGATSCAPTEAVILLDDCMMSAAFSGRMTKSIHWYPAPSAPPLALQLEGMRIPALGGHDFTGAHHVQQIVRVVPIGFHMGFAGCQPLPGAVDDGLVLVRLAIGGKGVIAMGKRHQHQRGPPDAHRHPA